MKLIDKQLLDDVSRQAQKSDMVQGSSTSQATARQLVACKARKSMTWLIPILV